MKKPEKKGCEGHGTEYSLICGGCHKAKSRNEAIEEYERYLPSEDDVSVLIFNHLNEYHCGAGREYNKHKSNDLAKAIAKRIGKGEK